MGVYILGPLPTNGAYMHRETFSFMMSYLAMPLGDRFCMSRKGGTEEAGWVHPKGANSIGLVMKDS